MSIKRFRLVCSIASVLLKVGAGVSIIGVLLVWFLSLFNLLNPSFTLDFSDAQIFSMGSILSEAEEKIIGHILGPLFFIILGLIFWKGSQSFDELYLGKSPFRSSFAQSIRRIALSLIAFDLLSPIAYSIVRSIITGQLSYFLRFTSMFMIGLILYVVSEILFYGIHLQEFSDDTV